MKSRFLLILSLVFALQISYAQGFTKPSEGKAVIYFAQTAVGLGHTMYFDGMEFIGKLQGRSYLRYECEPGEYTFMALKGANKEFLVANVAADKIYIVSIREVEKFGGYAPHFVKVDPSKAKFAKRMLSLVNKEAPTTKDLALEKKMEQKWAKFNKKAYAKFESKQKAKNKHMVLTPDMNYAQ